MATEDVKSRVAALARQHNVQVTWADLGDDAGHTHDDRITLDKNMDAHTTLSTFFHELGHVHCFRNGIFRDFHETDLFERTAKYCNWKNGLKVEQWVDKWAEQQAKRDMPELGRIYQAYWDIPMAARKRCLESAMPSTCKRR